MVVKTLKLVNIIVVISLYFLNGCNIKHTFSTTLHQWCSFQMYPWVIVAILILTVLDWKSYWILLIENWNCTRAQEQTILNSALDQCNRLVMTFHSEIPVLKKLIIHLWSFWNGDETIEINTFKCMRWIRFSLFAQTLSQYAAKWNVMWSS